MELTQYCSVAVKDYLSEGSDYNGCLPRTYIYVSLSFSNELNEEMTENSPYIAPHIDKKPSFS